jgi:AraC family transcriptional activator of pobA
VTASSSGENRTSTIRRVDYAPPAGHSAGAEVADLATLLRRAGPVEFQAPQRLGFELVLQIRSGRTSHEVDFTSYSLGPGDVFWIHAGQVHRWGDISAIDGPVLMLPPDLYDEATAHLFRRLGISHLNHWPGAASPGSLLWESFSTTAGIDRRLRAAPALEPEARDQALTHAVLATLLTLAGSNPAGTSPIRPRNEVFSWFEEEIEKSFHRERTVAAYAQRLGYSERTLNRLARAHAGTTAKELIDRRVVLEAKRRLIHETVPIVEIADRLGFEDAANFSKYFSHRTGTTPSAFRTASRPR